MTRTSDPATQVPWKRLARDEKAQVVRLPFCGTLLHRTDSLFLDLPLIKFSDTAPSWLTSGNANQLRHAKLGLKYPVSTYLLTDIFSGGKERLKYLTLEKLFVPWSSLASVTTLTKLDLDFSNRPDPETHSELDATILEVFRKSHRLEDISISCTDPLRGIPEPAADDLIHLPSLQFLRLDLMTFDATFILHSIATPKKMSVVARPSASKVPFFYISPLNRRRPCSMLTERFYGG